MVSRLFRSHISSRKVLRSNAGKISDAQSRHLAESVAHEAPKRYSKGEIRDLLADQGRNIISTLVGECVEQCGRWTQIVRSLERKEMPEEDDTDETIVSLLPEARYILGLWRHRLQLLTMIVEAQQSLRAPYRYP